MSHPVQSQITYLLALGAYLPAPHYTFIDLLSSSSSVLLHCRSLCSGSAHLLGVSSGVTSSMMPFLTLPPAQSGYFWALCLGNVPFLKGPFRPVQFHSIPAPHVSQGYLSSGWKNAAQEIKAFLYGWLLPPPPFPSPFPPPFPSPPCSGLKKIINS